jgi:hypothetical protein
MGGAEWNGMERGNKKRKGEHEMKKWKVYATSITQYEIEVDANSKYEAFDMALSIDGGDWSETRGYQPDWEVKRAEEVQS